MGSTLQTPRPDQQLSQNHRPTDTRRLGYVISIAVNVAFLYIVHRVLTWEWPGFVTEDWNDVLPIMTISLVTTIAITALYLWYDPPWFKSAGNIITTVVGLLVAVRMWQVFPFDFAGHEVDWTVLARVVIGVSVVGMIIGIIAETLKLTAWLLRQR